MSVVGSSLMRGLGQEIKDSYIGVCCFKNPGDKIDNVMPMFSEMMRADDDIIMVLSPKLFGMFVNDVTVCLNQTKAVSIGDGKMNLFYLPTISFCSRKVKQGYRPLLMACRLFAISDTWS